MVSKNDIAEFGDLWALMYYTFAKEMIDSFGEEGKKALIRAIKAYGQARGQRLQKRHEEMGLPINLRTLFENYDLPDHPDTEKSRTVFEDDKLGYEDWLKGDLEILKRCDAIIMVHNWEDSKGANKEHQLAVDLDIPIYYAMAGIPTPHEYVADYGED